MMIEPITLLRRVFPGMAEEAISEIALLAQMRTYPADTVLCHEGIEESVFYILGEGRVAITQHLGSEERFLRYSEAGQYFGEMALIANTPRNATVRTVVESTVLQIDKDIFVEMIRQHPVIALTMFGTTVGWLRSNDAASIAALTAQKYEIERAYDELRLQEQRRTEFLTTLAHELRTPLTTANGFIQLIKSGNLTGPGLTMGVNKVADGVERIVTLVNDLMFVQEMDLLEPTVRPVDVSLILTEMVHDIRAKIGDHPHIALTLPEELPQVEADIDHLTRALRALLDNAIKFDPEGGDIHIEVTSNGGRITVEFIDPGIGIDPEFLPHIFERYSRREQWGDSLFGGIGLGLPIAKHLIESFGGTISVSSVVDQGSTFTVSLPALILDQDTPDQPPSMQAV